MRQNKTKKNSATNNIGAMCVGVMLTIFGLFLVMTAAYLALDQNRQEAYVPERIAIEIVNNPNTTTVNLEQFKSAPEELLARSGIAIECSDYSIYRDDDLVYGVTYFSVNYPFILEFVLGLVLIILGAFEIGYTRRSNEEDQKNQNNTTE